MNIRKCLSWTTGMWHKLYRKFEKKLVNTLVIFITGILFLVIGSLTYISYSTIQKDSVRQAILTGTNNLKLVNENYQRFFKSAEQYTLPNGLYDDLMLALRNESNDYSSRAYLENYVSSLFYSRDDIDSVDLYILSQNEDYTINRSEYSRVNLDNEVDAAKTKWYKKAASASGVDVESMFSSGKESFGGGYNFMALYRLIAPIGDTKPIAALAIHFNTTSTDKIELDAQLENDDHLILTDAKDTIYYADNNAGLDIYKSLAASDAYKTIKKGLSMGHFDCVLKGKKYLVFYDVSDDVGCKLIKLIDYDNIYASAKAATDWSLVIGLFFLALSIVMTLFITRAITKPLERLSDHMVRFGEGNFDIEGLNIRGRNEISQLGRQFNRMVTQINDLINERYKMKITEKNAVLKALETEINPHFLYNALQVISTKALKSGVPEINDMVCALAMSFRYCISGADVVKLFEELGHIDNYLKLQKARFGARLNVVRDIDDNMREVMIPKLSIQTLVENSIKHALDKMVSGITITIKVQLCEGRARISDCDNGPGMTPESLSTLCEDIELDATCGIPEEKNNKSIGLRNLNSRLVLIFGEESRIHIINSSKGVEIYFFVPLRTM